MSAEAQQPMQLQRMSLIQLATSHVPETDGAALVDFYDEFVAGSGVQINLDTGQPALQPRIADVSRTAIRAFAHDAKNRENQTPLVQLLLPESLVVSSLRRYYTTFPVTRIPLEKPGMTHWASRQAFIADKSATAKRQVGLYPEVAYADILIADQSKRGNDIAAHALKELMTAYGLTVEQLRNR